MNEYEERRHAEQLARAKTAAQRETMERLHGNGQTAWPESRQGKTVVSEFRRYVETKDPEKIGKGLYHWSTMGSGGLNDIAHFNLYGFRGVYPHPAVYIERLLIPEVSRWPDEDQSNYHSLYVYTDGMTAAEVALQIIEIAAENRTTLLTDYKERVDAEKLATATALADDLGMQLVPK